MLGPERSLPHRPLTRIIILIYKFTGTVYIIINLFFVNIIAIKSGTIIVGLVIYRLMG